MKKIGLFTKVNIILFIAVTVFALIGRNHLFIGSFLSFARWLLLVSGLWFLYRIRKNQGGLKTLKTLLIIAITGLFVEFSWVSFSEYRGEDISTGKELSLMTYNLYFKNNYKKNSIDRILEENADILVLQEITLSWNTTLGKSLGNRYPYRKVIALNGTHGTGIYSKYPIGSHKRLNNSSNLPIAQIITVKVGKQKIRLINAHLASPAIAVENPDRFFELYTKNYRIRQQQLDKINTLARKDDADFDCQILIGDLNTIRYEPIFRDLTKLWYNLSDISWIRYNANFPNSGKIPPVMSLDYIMLRGSFTGESFSVVEGGSSDHLAIKGVVKI